jgi:FKBP-type peptidyl-prolyl cis-trans isomerase FkpA
MLIRLPIMRLTTCGVLLWLLAVAGCVSQPSFSPGPIDADAPTEFTQTESGLKYRILRRGNGLRPKVSDSVKVHYAGWLDDGTEFDSSYRRGKPATFALTQVVPGWTEGLQLVERGGMIELEIPSELGYGPQGSPPVIPPNSTLHFKVELFEIH